jgi:hypothetical protein
VRGAVRPPALLDPMNTYSIFGRRFRGPLEFPDLDPAGPGPADWTLRIVHGPSPALPVLETLGTAPVTDSVQVTLLRHEAGLRLVFDDTGVFDLADDHATITWYEEPGAIPDAVRLDVTGRVLPLALHMAGTLTLHGSAVRLAGGALAFMGPKHHGKSTLALALARQGAELLSDDAVPVGPGAVPTTCPGVRRGRLWTDAAVRLGMLEGGDAAVGEKHLLPAGRVGGHDRPVPLEAVYLLAPAGEGASRPVRPDRPVRRVRLPAVQAAMALVSQMKLGPLLGGSEAPRVLRACAALSGRLPVYRLEVVRDFELLGEMVDTVVAWHAPTGAHVAAGHGATGLPPHADAAGPGGPAGARTP